MTAIKMTILPKLLYLFCPLWFLNCISLNFKHTLINYFGTINPQDSPGRCCGRFGRILRCGCIISLADSHSWPNGISKTHPWIRFEQALIAPFYLPRILWSTKSHAWEVGIRNLVVFHSLKLWELHRFKLALISVGGNISKVKEMPS